MDKYKKLKDEIINYLNNTNIYLHDGHLDCGDFELLKNTFVYDDIIEIFKNIDKLEDQKKTSLFYCLDAQILTLLLF